jgi:hypothetical protein
MCGFEVLSLLRRCVNPLQPNIFFLVRTPTLCCWSYCITVEFILVFIPLYQRITFHTTFFSAQNRVSYGSAAPLHTPFCTIWYHTPTFGLGWKFLQESSGFLCFPFLCTFFHRNHDSCSAVFFLEPLEESCLYWAYVESYVGYKFGRHKQSMYNSMTLQWLLFTTIDAPPPPLLVAAFVAARRGREQERASVHTRLPRMAYLEEWHKEEEGGGACNRCRRCCQCCHPGGTMTLAIR